MLPARPKSFSFYSNPGRDEHGGCGGTLGSPHLTLGNQTGVRGAYRGPMTVANEAS